MKRIIVNLGAVAVAFLIGIAINNACAKMENGISKASDDAGTGQTTNGDGGGTKFNAFNNVDGLIVGHDGKVYNKLVSANIQLGEDMFLGGGYSTHTDSYTYDEKGRLIQLKYGNIGGEGGSVTVSYTYSGLVVTESFHAVGYDPEFMAMINSCKNTYTYAALKEE